MKAFAVVLLQLLCWTEFFRFQEFPQLVVKVSAYPIPYPPYFRVPCECETHNNGHRWLVEVMLADMFANPRRSMAYYRYHPDAPDNLRQFFQDLNHDQWCQRFISGTYFDVLRQQGKIVEFYVDLALHKGYCLPLELMIQFLCLQSMIEDMRFSHIARQDKAELLHVYQNQMLLLDSIGQLLPLTSHCFAEGSGGPGPMKKMNMPVANVRGANASPVFFSLAEERQGVARNVGEHWHAYRTKLAIHELKAYGGSGLRSVLAESSETAGGASRASASANNGAEKNAEEDPDQEELILARAVKKYFHQWASVIKVADLTEWYWSWFEKQLSVDRQGGVDEEVKLCEGFGLYNTEDLLEKVKKYQPDQAMPESFIPAEPLAEKMLVSQNSGGEDVGVEIKKPIIPVDPATGSPVCDFLATLLIPPNVPDSASVLAHHRAALVRLGGNTLYLDLTDKGGFSNLFRCRNADPYGTFWSRTGALLFSTYCTDAGIGHHMDKKASGGGDVGGGGSLADGAPDEEEESEKEKEKHSSQKVDLIPALSFAHSVGRDLNLAMPFFDYVRSKKESQTLECDVDEAREELRVKRNFLNYKRRYPHAGNFMLKRLMEEQRRTSTSTTFGPDDGDHHGVESSGSSAAAATPTATSSSTAERDDENSAPSPLSPAARPHSVACFSLITYPHETPAMDALSKTVAPYCDEFTFFVSNRTAPKEFNGYRVHDLHIQEDEWGSKKQVNFLQKWASIVLESYENYYENDAIDGGLELAARNLEDKEKKLAEIIRGRVWLEHESVTGAREEEKRAYNNFDGGQAEVGATGEIMTSVSDRASAGGPTPSGGPTPFHDLTLPSATVLNQNRTASAVGKEPPSSFRSARHHLQPALFPPRTAFANEQEEIFYRKKRNFHGHLPENAEDWEVFRRLDSDLSDLKTQEERDTEFLKLETAQKEYGFAKFKLEKHVEAMIQLQGKFAQPEPEPDPSAENSEKQEVPDGKKKPQGGAVIDTGFIAAGKSSAKFIPDWYCFLESDVYFIPENFKRYALLHNYDPWRQALFLGHVWLYGNVLMGQVTEHNYGSCLSRRAYSKLAVKFQNLRNDELEDQRVLLERAKTALEKEIRKAAKVMDPEGDGEGPRAQDDEGKRGTEEESPDLYWIRREQERIWGGQEVVIDHVDGIMPGEIFRSTSTSTSSPSTAPGSGDGAGAEIHGGKNQPGGLSDLLDAALSEDTDSEAPPPAQETAAGSSAEKQESARVHLADIKDPPPAEKQKPPASRLAALNAALRKLETRAPTLKDPDLYIGTVRPSAANHFGTRRIPTHFQCLPFKPNEWHDSIGIVQACLFDIGVFSSNPQHVTDSLGRYYWAQALNKVVALQPPVRASDLSILAPKDVQENYKMLKGMWVARVWENKICLAKRREKQLVRLMWLREHMAGGAGSGGRSHSGIDAGRFEVDTASWPEEVDVARHYDSAASSTSSGTTFLKNIHNLLYHTQHFMAYGDTGGLDAETLAAAGSSAASSSMQPEVVGAEANEGRRRIPATEPDELSTYFTDSSHMANVASYEIQDEGASALAEDELAEGSGGPGSRPRAERTVASSVNTVLAAYLRDQKPTYAYADYPICFHGHRAAKLNTAKVIRNTGEKVASKEFVKKKAKNFSLEEVDRIVRGGGGRDYVHSGEAGVDDGGGFLHCPYRFCGEYRPQVWGSQDVMLVPGGTSDAARNFLPDDVVDEEDEAVAREMIKQLQLDKKRKKSIRKLSDPDLLRACLVKLCRR